MIGNYTDLRHKRFLITGASSGIGMSIAAALAENSAQIIITGRNREALEQLRSSIIDDKSEPEQVQIRPADLSNLSEIEELIESLPEINGICHSAGIIKPLLARYLNKKTINEVFDINYIAPAMLTSGILSQKKLSRRGSVVFISSIASSVSYKGGAVYSGSKAALEAYCRNIAIEHAKLGIRANCVKPAMVKTAIFDATEQSVSPEKMQAHEREYPLGFGEVTDVSEATLFLLSSASRWITGTTLVMDGGLTAGK